MAASNVVVVTQCKGLRNLNKRYNLYIMREYLAHFNLAVSHYLLNDIEGKTTYGYQCIGATCHTTCGR